LIDSNIDDKIFQFPV